MAQSSVKMFKVFFLVGGWSNMEDRSVVGLFTEEQANAQCLELNRMGYPAQKIEQKSSPIEAYFVSHFECDTDEEKKRQYACAKAIGFAPINQKYAF